MRISGFSWFAPAALPRMTPTDALFADQSHSIPDHLVALLSHSRAWNCSAETAPAARQSSDEPAAFHAKRTRPYAFYPSLHDAKPRMFARISEWLLRVWIADLRGSRRERPDRADERTRSRGRARVT